MNNTLKPQRNYGIDLLRIFSMFLIALLHILGQGGVIAATNNNALKFNTACILEIGTYCCVNCFALISGYVGYNSKFRYTNIVMLWLRVLFYTVGITAIFAFAMPEAMVNSSETSGEFFLISEKWDNAVFPLISGQYWYFSSYFICYLLTPVLNKAVEAVSQKQMKRTLATVILFISIPPIFSGKDVFNTIYGFSSLWLIVLYLVGAYMKKYNSLSQMSKINAFMGYVASIAVTWAAKLLLTDYFPDFTRPALLVNYISPTIIASSVFLFVLFKNISPSKICCKIIAFFSPLAFSVYIIHVNPLIWDNIMKDLFKPIGTLSAPLMLVSVIGAAIGLYLFCSLIDAVRHYMFRLLKIQQLVVYIENKISEIHLKKETNT